MTVVESGVRSVVSSGEVASVPIRRVELPSLPQPPRRFTPVPLVELCYTLVHAAEAVGIRDLADGEYLPGDTTLEQGIERQLNSLLDEVGCTQPRISVARNWLRLRPPVAACAARRRGSRR